MAAILESFERFESNMAVSASTAWSYGDLARRAAAFAAAARPLGNGPLAAVFADPGWFLPGVCAALSCGMPYVPIDPRWPGERIQSLLDDVATVGFLTEPGLRARCATLGRDVAPVIGPGALEAVARPLASPRDEWAASKLAYILYTSGSTGAPKGVMQSHGGLLHNARTYIESIGIESGDRLALVTSLACDAAVMDIYGALLSGASIHHFDVRRLGTTGIERWLREARISILHATPTVFRHICRSLATEAHPSEFSEVRAVVLGGEPVGELELEAFERWFSSAAVLVNGFGPTECTMGLQYHMTHGTELVDGLVPLGEPLDGVEVMLLDGADNPTERAGTWEIALRSPGVALGYWGMPELSRERFPPALAESARRAFRTGDMARRLDDGRLIYVGRGDRQVSVRGHRIELGEIEAALRGLEGVADAVVTMTTWPRPRLVAFVQPTTANQAPAGEKLLAALARRLPPEQIPAQLDVVAMLPLTTSGKLDRRALAALASHAERPHRPSQDLDPDTRLIVAIWSELLGCEVQADASPLQLGADSVMVIDFCARVRALTGLELDLDLVYRRATIAQLGARLVHARATAAPRRPADEVAHEAPDAVEVTVQQRRYLARCADTSGIEFHVIRAIELLGPLDVERLAWALGRLVARHDSLRALFPPGADVMQVARGEVALPLPVWDSSGAAPEQRAGDIERAARALAARPFDLDRPPLIRAALIGYGANHHVLILVMHHLITDARSRQLLERDLYALYERGQPLPSAAPQYLDYARAQQRELQGPAAQVQLQWWVQTLGSPELWPIPMRAGAPRVGVGVIETGHGSDARARLDQSTQALGVTAFVFLLAVIGDALGRWSGQDTLVVTTDCNNRDTPEVAEVVGLAADVLPIRIDRRGIVRFAELVSRVHEFLGQALARRRPGFAAMLNAIQPGILTNYDRALPIAFFIEDAEPSVGMVGATGTLEFRSWEIDSGVISRPLYIIAALSSDDVRIAFHYRRGDLEYADVAEIARNVSDGLGRALAEVWPQRDTDSRAGGAP